jgi:putative FmdB family regulatory protein
MEGVFFMPVYDFKCGKCGDTHEYYVKSFDGCPEKCICGKTKKLKKVDSFSSSKPILKGNGFYETDYKK